MKKHWTVVVLIVLSLAIGSGWLYWRAGACRHLRLSEAEIITVRGEYALVLPTPSTMERLFGADWHRQSLFYRYNRALAASGQPIAVTTSPMLPLAKGSPVLVISGDEWPDLICSVASLEKMSMATLHIDLRRGSFSATAPAIPLRGVPETTPDGRLVLHSAP